MALCVLAALLIHGNSAAENSGVNEANIKAAILYNLIRYADWQSLPKPQQDSDTFNVCTRTSGDMRKALSGLAGKQIHDRTLNISHMTETNEAYEKCNVLFLSEGSQSLPANLPFLHDHNILTIGDSPELLKAGMCMSIQRQGNKVRFSINRDAVKATNIKLSSKILKLAVVPE